MLALQRRCAMHKGTWDSWCIKYTKRKKGLFLKKLCCCFIYDLLQEFFFLVIQFSSIIWWVIEVITKSYSLWIFYPSGQGDFLCCMCLVNGLLMYKAALSNFNRCFQILRLRFLSFVMWCTAIVWVRNSFKCHFIFLNIVIAAIFTK